MISKLRKRRGKRPEMEEPYNVLGNAETMEASRKRNWLSSEVEESKAKGAPKDRAKAAKTKETGSEPLKDEQSSIAVIKLEMEQPKAKAKVAPKSRAKAAKAPKESGAESLTPETSTETLEMDEPKAKAAPRGRPKAAKAPKESGAESLTPETSTKTLEMDEPKVKAAPKPRPKASTKETKAKILKDEKKKPSNVGGSGSSKMEKPKAKAKAAPKARAKAKAPNEPECMTLNDERKKQSNDLKKTLASSNFVVSKPSVQRRQQGSANRYIGNVKRQMTSKLKDKQFGDRHKHKTLVLQRREALIREAKSQKYLSLESPGWDVPMFSEVSKLGPTPKTPTEALNACGFYQFRPGQLEAVSSVLERKVSRVAIYRHGKIAVLSNTG